MKYLTLILSFALVACNESSQKTAAVDAPVSSCVGGSYVDIYDSPSGAFVLDSGGLTIGNFIAQQGDCLWVEDAENPSYHYAVSATTGELRESAALVFSDLNCSSAVGEIFDYPLHLSGDVYVFSFEGQLYEYPIGGNNWVDVGPAYRRAPAGSCEPFDVEFETVRVVQPSSFARVFAGPVSL